jgi:hypothetical protein
MEVGVAVDERRQDGTPGKVDEAPIRQRRACSVGRADERDHPVSQRDGRRGIAIPWRPTDRAGVKDQAT